MKKGPCPRCGGAEIFEIAKASLPDHDSSNLVQPLTVVAHYGPSGVVGMFGDKMERHAIQLSACVCASCGYTEFYARDLSMLAAFADKGVAGVRKVTRKA